MIVAGQPLRPGHDPLRSGECACLNEGHDAKHRAHGAEQNHQAVEAVTHPLPLENQADGAHHQADLQEESGDVEGVPRSAETLRFGFPFPGPLDLTQLAVFLENPVLLPAPLRAKEDFLTLLLVTSDVRFEIGQQLAHAALGFGRDHSRIQQYPEEVTLTLDQ